MQSDWWRASNSFWDISLKNSAIWLMESILIYTLKTRFFQTMQLSQNHIANYGASFKAQKVMLPLLKCQIFRIWSKCLVYRIIYTTNTIFQNLALSLFSIYGKIYSYKKLEYPPSRSWKNASDGQTDRHRWTTNRTDFMGPLPKRWRFDHVFRKFENKIFLRYFGLIVNHMERITTRKRNTFNIVQYSKSSKTMILSKCT